MVVLKYISLFVLLGIFLVSCQELNSFEEAVYQYETGSYNQSKLSFSKIIGRDSSNLTAKYYLALSDYQKCDYQTSSEYFSELIDANYDNMDILQKRAECYMVLNYYEKAILDFSELIKSDSLNGLNYYYRGICYFMIDIPVKANEDWIKASKLRYESNIDYDLMSNIIAY